VNELETYLITSREQWLPSVHLHKYTAKTPHDYGEVIRQS